MQKKQREKEEKKEKCLQSERTPGGQDYSGALHYGGCLVIVAGFDT